MGPQITLARLLLQESGTYNQQYARPWAVNDTGWQLDALEARINDITRADPISKITGTMVAGLTNNLIAPSANAAQAIMIPNNWNERRLRFVLEVHVNQGGIGGMQIYYFQGWTDYMGVAMDGSIDPNMPFFINSYTCVHRSSGVGSYGYTDVLAETGQVINGQMISQNHMPVYSLTPHDIFVGIQSDHLTQGYSTYDQVQVMDDRIDRSNDIYRSKRSNLLGSNYLANLIDHYRQATLLADMGTGRESTLSRAISTSYEKNLYENPFIMTLSNLLNRGVATTFTMNDLAQIDSSINTRTDLQSVGQAVRMASVGDTDDNWGDRRLETQIATTLSNGIVALMSECMLTQVRFHCTTMTLNSVPMTTLDSNPGAVQLLTTVNTPLYLNQFVRRLETELLPDITQGGLISVDFQVSANLYNDMQLNLSVGEGPHETWIAPCFCDALRAPVTTGMQNVYIGMLQGMEGVVQACSFADPSSPGASGIVLPGI